MKTTRLHGLVMATMAVVVLSSLIWAADMPTAEGVEALC